MKLLLIIAALAYVLFPWDLLPDVLPGFGWLDDLVVLGLLVRYLSMQWRQQKMRKTQGSQEGKGSPGGGQSKGSGRTSGSGGGDYPHDRHQRYDPYAILEVDRNASAEEIKKAYRRLVSKYHPDKVAHLGDEFKEMAEKRFKEIQQAYQDLKT